MRAPPVQFTLPELRELLDAAEGMAEGYRAHAEELQGSPDRAWQAGAVLVSVDHLERAAAKIRAARAERNRLRREERDRDPRRG